MGMWPVWSPWPIVAFFPQMGAHSLRHPGLAEAPVRFAWWRANRNGDELAAGPCLTQRDADPGDAQRPGVSGEHPHHEAEHPVGGWSVRNGRQQRRLRITKGTESPGPGGPGEGGRAGRDECHPDLGVAVAGMYQGKRCLFLHLPGTDLFVLQTPLEGGDQLLAARVPVGVDRDLHADSITYRDGLGRFCGPAFRPNEGRRWTRPATRTRGYRTVIRVARGAASTASARSGL